MCTYLHTYTRPATSNKRHTRAPQRRNARHTPNHPPPPHSCPKRLLPYSSLNTARAPFRPAARDPAAP